MPEHLVSSDQVAVSYIALRARVIDLLRSTPESSGNIVVPCTPEWTIRQLAAHLVGVPEDVLAGRMEGVASDAWTHAQVERYGDLTLTELADLFESSAPKIDAIIHNFPQPIISQFVMDAVTHEQDMRRALGIHGHLSGPVAEHTIDRLISTIPIVIGKRASTPDGQSVVIDITADPVLGGVRRHIICTVVNGRAALIDIEPEAPLCRLTMDTQTFLTLATGRRKAGEATHPIEYAGDLIHGHKIVASMNMMI